MAVHQTSVKTEWPLNVQRHGWLESETDKKSLSFELNAEQSTALRKLTDRHTSTDQHYTIITRDQFSHPSVDPFFARMTEELKWGKGLVFLRGIPLEGYTLDEIRTLYWGIGTHFGTALSQSGVGDKMGDVMFRAGASRGYTSDQELELHTDYTEIGVLLCIQPAKSGGENVFASSLTLWDIVEREHPEFIPVLKRGFRCWREGEYPADQEAITSYPVPVFGEKNGLRSVYRSWITADATARFLGQPLSPLEAGAIKFIYELLGREELKFSASLDRGEAVFFNNFEVMHSRTSFVQWEAPAKTRHLLRLWFQCTPPRAIPDEMKYYENPSGLLGHDPDAKLAGQQFTTWRDDPAARFMKEYFADSLSGKQRESDLVIRHLEVS